MRNSVISVLVIFGIGMFVFSCEQRDSDEVTKIYESAYQSLDTNLGNYTTSFNKENNIVKTKGFWKHFFRIVGADALGALGGLKGGAHGALIGAIVGSGQCAIKNYLLPKAQKDKSQDYIVYDDDRIRKKEVDEGEIRDIIKENKKVTANNMGEFHNMYLNEISAEIDSLREVSGRPSTKSSGKNDITFALTSIVSDKVVPSMSLEMRTEIKETVDTTNKLLQSGNMEELEEFFAKKGLENHYKILQRYINNLASIEMKNNTQKEQLLAYTQGYLNIIKSSSIPKEDAENICGAIMVAINSNTYWERRK